MLKKKLFIEQEISSRELYGNFLLATELLNYETCFEVHIGISDDIRPFALLHDSGYFLFKSIGPNDNMFLSQLKFKNFRCGLLPSEGITSCNKQEWYMAVFGNCTYPFVDDIFTWGDEQMVYLKNIISPKINLYNFGVPRFEFLKNCKEQHKKYDVLITTNFASAVHKMGQDVYKSFILKQNWSDDFKNQSLNEIEDKSRVLNYYLEFITHLITKNPNLRIALRSHPSESFEFYKNYFKDTSIIFDRSKTSYEAILSSKVVVHYDSTISLECFFLNIPCISYIPFIAPTMAPDPREFSLECNSIDSTLLNIDKIIYKDIQVFNNSDTLKVQNLVFNSTGELNFKYFIDAVSNIDNTRDPHFFRILFFRLKYSLLFVLKSVLYKEKYAYKYKKFTIISKYDLKNFSFLHKQKADIKFISITPNLSILKNFL